MADTLFINELVAACRLGISNEEQAKAQSVWIDLELSIDAATAAARDDVREAVDYAKLAASVKQLTKGKPYHLLETLAEDIASLVLSDFATPEVLVRVKKRALPGIDSAQVEVVRRR